MKVRFTKHFPFGKFIAISLFGTIYCKNKGSYSKSLFLTNPQKYFRLIQHERTHWIQQKELLVMPFFIWYVIEWIFKIFTGRPYYNLSFEREARTSQNFADIYNVHVVLKVNGKIKHSVIFKRGSLSIQDAKNCLKQIDKIKYIEFIPTNTRNYILERKAFAFLKFIKE